MEILDVETIAPNINSYLSQLLSDYSEGVEIHTLHVLYKAHRPADCPELEFSELCLLIGWCIARFRSFTRISFDPLIICLVKPQ